MISYFKKKPHLIALILILIIATFFRSYDLVDRFDFGHDGDLYSWIVKDIVVNHHIRLIGQLTSAPGIFIGPFFYYSLIPFFLIFSMDPIGVTLFGVAIGILTTFSFYFVLSKFFTKNVGLIATFLYAVLVYTIGFDRWIVPTITTHIWSIWYLYTLIKLSRSDFSVLPLLGLLVGLIWNIHIALVPALIAIPVALFFVKKIPTFKQIIIFLLVVILTSAPLILFEARHGFSQTKSLFQNFTASFGSDKNVTEQHKIILGQKNEFGKLNLDQNSKFSLDIEPQTFKEGDIVNVKITSKNPKYSTSIITLDCGDPKRYEIGSISSEFKWSTKNCNPGEHYLTASARTTNDSFWKKSTEKFFVVFEKEKTNINSLFLYPFNLPIFYQYLASIFIMFLPLIIWRLNILQTSFVAILYAWIFGVFAFFTFSSTPVSEYYLASINVLLIANISIIFSRIYLQNNIGRYFITFLLSITLAINFLYFLPLESNKKGYTEKKKAVEFIAADAKAKNLPCIGINYITKSGENVGFRYLFYLHNLHLVHPSTETAIYNIVIPYEFSKEVEEKFGHIGLILPTSVPSKEAIEKSCLTPDTNLTDSMFGYVD